MNHSAPWRIWHRRVGTRTRHAVLPGHTGMATTCARRGTSVHTPTAFGPRKSVPLFEPGTPIPELPSRPPRRRRPLVEGMFERRSRTTLCQPGEKRF